MNEIAGHDPTLRAQGTVVPKMPDFRAMERSGYDRMSQGMRMSEHFAGRVAVGGVCGAVF